MIATDEQLLQLPDGQRKVLLKIYQIARLRVQGIRDATIAAQFQLSQNGFARLVGSEQYKRVENEVLAQRCASIDRKAESELDALKRKLSTGVPLAVQGLIDFAMQSRDLRLKFAAYKEILDRDPNGTFSRRSAGAAQSVASAMPEAQRAQMRSDSANVAAEMLGEPITDKVQ